MSRVRFEIPSNSYLKPQPNYLYGKKLYSDGDSVAKGTGTDTLGSGFHSYAYYIAEKYGMNFTTEAVGGTTLAKNDDAPLGRYSLAAGPATHGRPFASVVL